jgi:AraC-like DNA-binding protein
MAGYADQAHQIRSWKRALGKTPGEYRRQGGSPLAAGFEHGGSGLSFYV